MNLSLFVCEFIGLVSGKKAPPEVKMVFWSNQANPWSSPKSLLYVMPHQLSWWTTLQIVTNPGRVSCQKSGFSRTEPSMVAHCWEARKINSILSGGSIHIFRNRRTQWNVAIYSGSGAKERKKPSFCKEKEEADHFAIGQLVMSWAMKVACSKILEKLIVCQGSMLKRNTRVNIHTA